MANAADPLNAIGLALASLTSPVSLFSGCVQAYSVLAGVKDAGNAIHHQHWLFKIEHTRLLVWGQNFDAFGDGLNPEKLSRPVYEAVVTTLAQIELLLQDAAKISANYGLRRETDRELPSNFTGLLEQQRDLVSHLDRSSSFLRRARWAIHDQASFARLVEQLRGYNDALYQFCPVEKRHHLTVAVETETLARTIIEDGLNGVRELQLQAMQNSPPPQIQILGRRAAARLWADERTREEDEDTVPHRPLHAMSLDDMEILSELRNDTPTRRAWARHLHRYAPPYTSTDLVIEWRPYNERHVKERLQRRIEALVRMLQQTPKPPSFRALDCLGFLEDTKRPRFGLVFRFPQECQTSSTGAPLTLFQILSERESPYLGERFLLAAFLAEALYEFHASGWLHKGINSHNILFFPRNAAADDENQPQGGRAMPNVFRNPFFAGFALARPDDPNADTSMLSVGPELGIYQHPDVQGSDDRPMVRYHPSHDIYSLGTLLVEIGTWNVLKKFHKDNLSGLAFKDRLLDRALPLLGQSMGKRYQDAVRKCLEGRFDYLQSDGGRARDGEDYLRDLRRSFYWEVVMVLRDTRV